LIEAITTWEFQFLHLISDGATQVTNAFWTLVTMFGEAGIFWIVLALVLMFFKKTRRIGFAMGLTLLLGVIMVSGVLKPLVDRPRPYVADEGLKHLLAWGEMTSDASFPSGHTTASVGAAVTLFLNHKKWGIAALVLAVFVSLSRLFLVVHYPTDVLAGAVVGSCFALLSHYLIGLLWKKYGDKLS